MEAIAIGVLFGTIGGAVLGYWLASHIHSVANSVVKATTIHTGIAPLDNAAASVGKTIAADINKLGGQNG